MYYLIKLSCKHYIKITDVIEVISVTDSGRYNYQCFTHELIIRVFKDWIFKKSISQKLYDLQAKAWAEYRKANKPEILGDAVPELVEKSLDN